MSKQINALKLALEAIHDLEGEINGYRTVDFPIPEKAKAAIKEALSSPNGEAQPEQEPVAWMKEGWGPDCGPYIEFYRDDEMGWRDRKEWTPLYTTPPQPKEPEQEQVIECDCITSIDPNGLRQTKCGSDQMRRAVQEGSAFSKQPEQEPVGEAYLCDRCHTPFDGAYECPSCGHNEATKEPVYTTPPQQKKIDSASCSG